jgi:hypothetical protein
MLQTRRKTMPGQLYKWSYEFTRLLKTNNIIVINTNRTVHSTTLILHVVLFVVQEWCNTVYFQRNIRPEKKASHDDSASCDCGRHTGYQSWGKKFPAVFINHLKSP